MPGEGLTHGPPAAKKAGGSHHRFSQIIRHSLRDGFTAYTWSPRGPGFLAPVIARSVSRNLASASGGQDHTTSPSALARSSLSKPSASTASRAPRSWRSRYAPLGRGGMRWWKHGFRKNRS